MKNLLKIAGVLLLFLSVNIETNAQTSLGGGGTFLIPDGDSEIGINLRGTFGLNENMEIATGINYYLVDNVTLIGYNGDFHYLFGTDGEVRFYPLAGINFMTASAGGSSNSEFQFNIGGGTRLPISDKMSIYGEGKYILGDFDGIAITAGIMFTLGS
jgi:outer membrane protein X